MHIYVDSVNKLRNVRLCLIYDSYGLYREILTGDILTFVVKTGAILTGDILTGYRHFYYKMLICDPFVFIIHFIW